MNSSILPRNVSGDLYDESMPPTASAPLPAQLVVDWLTAIGFDAPASGSTTWTRYFPAHSYTISVDASGVGLISYGPEIVVGRATTTSLRDAENLVVLECVTALLHAGYPPSSIELEKSFHLGHSAGGWLDILVTRGGKTYLMIECKTAGDEYAKALRSLKSSSKNQLISYLVQDRDLEQAVLYSSELRPTSTTPTIERTYSGFPTSFLVGGNAKALFDNWDKKFYNTGLMESEPYEIAETVLAVADLKDMTQVDGQQLFNQFKEVLRRHAVSDNPNAFNKIFNLFICKILDEDKADPTEATEFQWRGSENDTIVLERLSGLYERGMQQFLKLKVEESSARLAGITANMTSAQRDEVSKLMADVRQYNNTNFAFIDVYDADSYRLNAEIVRDIVRLLQTKRLRYTQKHGFMGMFFEQLLNTSMKQESGQFFTPAPIAQFVNEALPMEQLIQRKIDASDPLFLPYAIDYAAGSGHFLTEYMDRIFKVLSQLPTGQFKTQTQKQRANAWRDAGLVWAGEFVYGIELDYRLAKTAKVSTFLNGDGDAKVIRGNGLGHFSHDEDFKKAGGKLVRPSGDAPSKDIATFDVVVANPPYSVSEFATSVNHGPESFDLWDHLGDRSDKIEALFIERTKHLLAPGGVAGLVLPTSFLTNAGVEIQARALMLRHFDVVAIVTLGNRVFIATETPCSIVFLRRRPNSDSAAITAAINEFRKTGRDATVFGLANAFQDYAETVHGTTFDVLHTSLKDPLTSSLEIFRDYEWVLKSKGKGETRIVDAGGGPDRPNAKMRRFVDENEMARMEAYFLTRDKSTVLVAAPEDSKAKKRFLGYEFSERKRHEGISFLSGTSSIETPLFDPADSNNPAKISTIIKSHFEDTPIAVPADLKEWMDVVPTREVLDMSGMTFQWTLSTAPKPPAQNFLVPTRRLGDLVDLIIGATPSRMRADYFNGTEPWLSVSEMKSAVVTDTKEKLTAAGVAASSVKKVMKGSLLVSFKLSIGKTAIAGMDLYTNEAIAALVPKPAPPGDEPWVDTEYLRALIELLGTEILRHESQAQKKIGRSLNTTYLKQLQIPLLDKAGRAAVAKIAADASLTIKDRQQKVAKLLWA